MARIDAGSALAFCVLHDLLGAAAFLAAHPLHAAYALFFHRGLLALAAFFCPLLLSTALLLVVLLTAAPYVAPGRAGARCLGSTCGVAVAALCAGLRPDGGLGLLGQLCSFVLGPAGVGEVVFVGEVRDAGGASCFLLEQERESFLPAAREVFAVGLPLQSLSGEEICYLSTGDFYEEDIFSFKDEIQEKNVVCEDLKKAPESLSSSSEHCFPVPGETFMPVPEMEEREKSINNVQSVSLPERKGFSSDSVEEKRLECDPVPLSAMETKKPERVGKPHSSISQRIRQWECGNLKGVLDEIEDNPVEIFFEKGSFKVVEEAMPLETESWDQKQSQDQLAQEESDRKQLPEEELVDVKEESAQSKVAEECIIDLQQAEEIASIIGEPEEDPPQEQRSDDVQAEEDAQPDGQDHQEDVQQPASEHADGGKSPLRSTSIARRVHTRTSSESLAGTGEGSPSKGKEWKRTLACKLYEERIQLKVCRDGAVAGACADDMDMLWEAYETGGGSSSAVAGDTKPRGGGGSKAKEESVVDEEEEEEDEEDDGPVRQLCCLQALKFSTRKMNLGGGKPSLSKISRVLKRMTALSRVGSRRK
ncbi:hypothetical protein CFC21_014834 [Triticum aestivum]|uniref:Uncharacterized protein n=2 Tax=Triticum aestivum TaxID=4565 RepID=A0A9R1DV89_WHEAT|nr:uncharacterized protein LOC123187146 [Triticum aestivum]KAF6998743.1 hypothetical protein CFC21_014834 [Triticum aestivum]